MSWSELLILFDEELELIDQAQNEFLQDMNIVINPTPSNEKKLMDTHSFEQNGIHSETDLLACKL